MAELLEQLHIDPGVIAAMVTGFLLLWFILARFLFRPVLALLHAREQDIRTTYEDAQKEHDKAQQFRADYEHKLAEIEAEARARMQEAVREAQSAKDEILAEARSRSEDILRRGQEDLEREREKAMAELRHEVVDIAVGAAGKLIEESLDEAKHRKLVNDFINKIGSMK